MTMQIIPFDELCRTRNNFRDFFSYHLITPYFYFTVAPSPYTASFQIQEQNKKCQ